MKRLRTVRVVCFCCLLIGALSSAGAVRIAFDYSYDSNSFFTPERRVLMERAAAEFTSRMTSNSWAQVDPTTAGGHYELAVVNPSTHAISWVTNAVIPATQITVYVGAIDFTQSPFSMMTDSTGDGATQLMGIRNVSGAMTNVLANPSLFRPVNASITFDLQGIQGFSAIPNIERQWHFDTDSDLNTDDRDPLDPHYNDYSDFYGTAVHELGHVLGIHNPGVFSAFLASDPNFCVAYMRQVQSDGQDGYVFTGTNASQFYYDHIGTNIPIEANTRCHFADGVRSVTADGGTSLTYEDNQTFRHGFSELEFGVFQDLGYVITPVPKASITGLVESNSNFNLRMSGLIPYLQFYLATNTDLLDVTWWENAEVIVPTGTVVTSSMPIPLGVNQLFFKLCR
jgi:hypothetical protein